MGRFSLLVFLVLVIATSPQLWAEKESIVVELRSGGTDPLIDFVPPPFGSADQARFSSEGLRITQFSDSRNKPTGVAGFKSTLAASGDFKATLDLKVTKLEPPTEDWGHGVIFSVFLSDPLQTTLKLNQVAFKGAEPGTVESMVEISGRGIQEPTYISGPPLKEGALIIERIGTDAIFSIQPKGEGNATEIARVPCPAEDVQCIEVWSTRVPKGNSPADVTFRKLSMESEGFYSYRGSETSWFTWWNGLIALQIAIVFGLVIYRQVRR